MERWRLTHSRGVVPTVTARQSKNLNASLPRSVSVTRCKITRDLGPGRPRPSRHVFTRWRPVVSRGQRIRGPRTLLHVGATWQ